MKKFKQIQTITDPILEPFFITKDDYGFTVKENISPNSNHFRTEGKGKNYEKSIGYYPKFEWCLEKIAKLKLEQQSSYNSIREYINDYETIGKQIEKYAIK